MFLDNIINNIKRKLTARKIGVPFSYENIVYYAHLPKIPVSEYSYIDTSTSNIQKNEIYVVDTILNIVNLYRLSDVDNTDDNILINIEFDGYLTMYYNFNNQKYIDLSNKIVSDLNNFFIKHKQVNSTYDSLDAPDHNIKVTLSYTNDNNIRKKLKIIDIDELFCYFNVGVKITREHINNNTICDIEFNECILMDDDEIEAFTNFNLQYLKNVLIKESGFNVK